MKIKNISKIVGSGKNKDSSASNHSDKPDNILYISGDLALSGNILEMSEIVISTNNINVVNLCVDYITIDQGAFVRANEVISKSLYLDGGLMADEATIDSLSLLAHSSIEGSYNVINLESIAGAKIKASISTYWQKPKHKYSSKNKPKEGKESGELA